VDTLHGPRPRIVRCFDLPMARCRRQNPSPTRPSFSRDTDGRPSLIRWTPPTASGPRDRHTNLLVGGTLDSRFCIVSYRIVSVLLYPRDSLRRHCSLLAHRHCSLSAPPSLSSASAANTLAYVVCCLASGGPRP
jgi:hypothetical protein